MGVEGSSGGVRRRERLTSEPRGRRVNLSFNETELEVLRLAAGREGMSPASWAGRQVMAVAQHVLVPVSRDAGDVLRELIAARVHLRETVTALRALAASAPPGHGRRPARDRPPGHGRRGGGTRPGRGGPGG